MSRMGLLEALKEKQEDTLVQLFEEKGVTDEDIAQSRRRVELMMRLNLSYKQRAAIMEYLADKVPAVNEWGYASYEARERRRLAVEYRELAQLEMMPEEEALEYKRSNFYRRYHTSGQITKWSDYVEPIVENRHTLEVRDRWGDSTLLRFTDADLEKKFSAVPELNGKVSLWRGNICELEFDAVVNAANSSLRGGGGIDGAIHDQAGALLDDECIAHGGCPTGETRVTKGYKMPAKYILHTVGPTQEDPDLLKSCYVTVLEEVKAKQLRTVAFCCVSAGIFGFPLIHSCHIALRTIREWLEKDDNASAVDNFCFCVFLPHELAVYERLLPVYFPRS
eukprot:TRINITY_DN2392_c0_g1_i1.p1 TRINITY_DN2392_c0_g1~~TRINITY_DN2392_c0_g1_i1.p1  ORF type:complete len:336 (+),score=70.35 TRINITY_DN2392_c0_g1_i1:43-1050(+)